MNGFWADGFDADLLKVVPAAADTLQPVADTRLWTYGHASNGRLNHPACWNGPHGLVSFFATKGIEPRPHASYHTAQPLIECTAAEMIRDAWVHSNICMVNNRHVWTPPSRWMEQLMYDLRGWRPLDDLERSMIRDAVTDTLTEAVNELKRIVDLYDFAVPF